MKEYFKSAENVSNGVQKEAFSPEIVEILKSIALFDKIDESNFWHILNCLNAKTTAYPKDSVIFLMDEPVSFVGILLSGGAMVVKEDYLGNRTILAELVKGDTFGETFACAGVIKSPVTVLVPVRCEVLFIDFKRIVTACSSACAFHMRLIENMLQLLAKKNLLLNQKIEFISKRTTREKLLSYFAVQMEKVHSNSFEIPFTRHELADYLCVDRSSMSRELSKMRKEGLLDFKGNYFEITTV